MLTVLGVSDKKIPSNKGKTYWDCICDCGRPHTVQGYYLTNGNTVSCGCKRKKHYKEMLKKRKESYIVDGVDISHLGQKPQKNQSPGTMGLEKVAKNTFLRLVLNINSYTWGRSIRSKKQSTLA